MLDEPRVLVGWGGFKGPPADGVVELGYSIAPAFRNRGIASDSVREMLRDAFSASEVRAVIAHTLAEPGPSTKVLEKTGFVNEGEVTDDADPRGVALAPFEKAVARRASVRAPSRSPKSRSAMSA